MSTQKLRDNAARLHRDKSLSNLIKVRDRNYVEPEMIQITVIEPVKIQQNVEKNENNKEEIMEIPTKGMVKKLK